MSENDNGGQKTVRFEKNGKVCLNVGMGYKDEYNNYSGLSFLNRTVFSQVSEIFKDEKAEACFVDNDGRCWRTINLTTNWHCEYTDQLSRHKL